MSSPDLLRLSFPSIRTPEKRRRPGCYVTRYIPYVLEDGVSHYEGTLRVQHLDKDKKPVPSDGEFLLASGDLYARYEESKQPPAGIPIFPREDYRYYLCLKDVPEWSISPTGFSFIFESHAFYPNGDQWNFRGNFQADMTWTLPPPGYPFDYLEGQVFERTGRPNGRVTMAWVSEYFRRAVVQIDREPGVMAPLGDGKVDGEVNWSHAFKEADWQMEVIALENPMAKPQNQKPSWTEGELADQLPDLCRSHDLDSVWRYYLLAVNKVDRVERGITYYYAPHDDPAQNFREVAVAVAGYEFRGDKWGKVHGTLQANKRLYFRVAVHEIGHAMSLEHNTADEGFMNTTEQLAIDAIEAKSSFSEDTPKYSFWLGD